jgi:polysaccharide export outer membrane protein
LGCLRHYSGNDLKLAPRGRTFNAQGEYIIGLNDRLTIRVIGSNDMNGEFVVSQAGTVSLPLIGAVQAAGQTERELSRILTEQYKTYLKNPVVSVGVTGYDSYKIYITGEVRKPGVYTFQEKTTLLQGIATAGGLGEFARGEIILHRAGRNGVIEKFVTDYKSVLKGENRLDGFILERGDVINVY